MASSRRVGSLGEDTSTCSRGLFPRLNFQLDQRLLLSSTGADWKRFNGRPNAIGFEWGRFSIIFSSLRLEDLWKELVHESIRSFSHLDE